MLTSTVVTLPDATVDIHGETIVVRSGAFSGLLESDGGLRIPLSLVAAVSLSHAWLGRSVLRIELTPAFGQPSVALTFDRRSRHDAEALVDTINRRRAVIHERTLREVESDRPADVSAMLNALRRHSVLTEAEHADLSRRIGRRSATDPARISSSPT